MSIRFVLALALLGTGWIVPSAGAACLEPRTLILALDGIPYRVALEAHARGAFDGWPEARPLIAPFPSVTNVSFTLMLQSVGVSPAPGYEVAHYDAERNDVIGGTPFGYKERAFAWRDHFDSVGTTLGGKLAIYTRPGKKARKELESAEAALLASPDDVVLAHVGSSDALQHLKGDAATLELLLELEDWVARLRERHLEATGRELDVVLLSDHGNSDRKIHGAGGFKRRLRRAGLRVVKRLQLPDDVVAATFGLVGYGALFTAPRNAARAAEAIATHPAVDLTAWPAANDALRLISRDGAAVVRWKHAGTERRFAYDAIEGDPLRIGPARSILVEQGRLDDEGFASDTDWFRQTALGDYPDAMQRLVDAFSRDHVENRATVLFSLLPGQAWGWQSAQASSWLRGGRLEGTHGALDRESTLGFFLENRAPVDPDVPALRADRALDGYLNPAERRARCAPPVEAGFAISAPP